MAAKPRVLWMVLVVVLAVLVVGAFVIWPFLEGQAPVIKLAAVPTHLGSHSTLDLTVSDAGRGLASVRVYLEQKGKSFKLFDRSYAPAGRWAAGAAGPVQIKLEVEPLKLGLGQGPAQLLIEARDRSFRGWLAGNLASRSLAVEVDTIPPRLTLLSQNIYLNRGGSALVVYRTSPDAVSHGVTVGPHRFPGYRPWQKRPDLALCVFAYDQALGKDANIQLWARDAAGNQAAATLPVRLRWRKFKHEEMQLSPRVLGALASRFVSIAPADLRAGGDLPVFVWINEKLRGINHHKIVSLCRHSQDKLMWQGPFERPRGKPMAGFGDRRTYFYQGKQISKAVHLGVDLADVAHTPIKAAAAGKVVHAGELGIYGNCVILDHGLGVFTLYGHLSALSVTPGQEVQRDAVLGHSGATGLALGDHLHFSVLVDGVFVRPAEWWDPHWMEDNLGLRFQQAGLPRP